MLSTPRALVIPSVGDLFFEEWVSGMGCKCRRERDEDQGTTSGRLFIENSLEKQ